ncbi:hypothetical protein RW080711_025 [Synechococcus phage S-RIM8]|uniref:DNA endonuclease V n=1 Tax=Synechococcus phage S-RIM8 TaxID=756278 RepID=A0A1D7SB32_9CAUD|nr:hypothetical protein RW080711_025 [Synechococcus phage S-RIM8]QBQ75135.1 hypothetical protein RW010115_025 [Synechococcus phage S-RIM8]
MKIIDDFLTPKEYAYIKSNALDNSKIPWNYGFGKSFGSRESSQDLRNQQLTYTIYHVARFPEILGTEYAAIVAPIINMCSVLAIHRIKANLELYSGEEKYESEFHYDWSDKTTHLPGNAMQCAIYYVNSNNGYTEFEDGTIIESVANRMVFFNNSMKHRGVSATDVPSRCVLNFNWFTNSDYYS